MPTAKVACAAKTAANVVSFRDKANPTPAQARTASTHSSKIWRLAGRISALRSGITMPPLTTILWRPFVCQRMNSATDVLDYRPGLIRRCLKMRRILPQAPATLTDFAGALFGADVARSGPSRLLAREARQRAKSVYSRSDRGAPLGSGYSWPGWSALPGLLLSRGKHSVA
jgi:hypothetical protein